MTITGRCLCGAIRWESSAPPVVTRVCWCRECQYIGAGSGTVNACFRTAAFTVTGQTSDYPSVADIVNQMHRRFCPSCGTPLFREADARPHLIFVPVGSGWPYYARPRRGSRPPITAADVRAVRARQRELVIPESFEWIEQTAPEMAAAATEADLEVVAHPLMVLAGSVQAAALPDGITVRIITPEDPELDRIWAVPAVAYELRLPDLAPAVVDPAASAAAAAAAIAAAATPPGHPVVAALAPSPRAATVSAV